MQCPLAGATPSSAFRRAARPTKSARTLGQSRRFARLEPVIRKTFDVPSMVRLSVGPSWATLTEAQRQQVMEGFGRYISAIYADRFDSYSEQRLQVIGEQPATADVAHREAKLARRGAWGAAALCR